MLSISSLFFFLGLPHINQPFKTTNSLPSNTCNSHSSTIQSNSTILNSTISIAQIILSSSTIQHLISHLITFHFHIILNNKHNSIKLSTIHSISSNSSYSLSTYHFSITIHKTITLSISFPNQHISTITYNSINFNQHKTIDKQFNQHISRLLILIIIYLQLAFLLPV